MTRSLGLGTLSRRGWRSTVSLGVLLALAIGSGTAFLTGSWGAATTTFENGLGDAVAQAPPYQRGINLELYTDTFLRAEPQRPPGPGHPAPFESVTRAVESVMSPHVRQLIGGEFFSAQSDPMVVKGTGVTGRTVQAVVRLDDGFGTRVRWVAGGTPGKATRELTIGTLSRGADQAVLPHRVRVIPVAMRDRTARKWGVGVGDVLRFERTNHPEDALTDSAAFVVTGLYAPRDSRDPFWSVETRMLGIAKVPTSQGGSIEEASVLAPTSSYGDLTDSLGRAPSATPGGVFPALHHQWRFTLDPDRLERGDTDAIRDLLSRLQVDPEVWSTEIGQPRVVTGLGQIFSDYDRSVRTATVIVSFAALGATVLTLLVLCLLALVCVRRRAGEIDLLSARGASPGQVFCVVLVPVAAWSMPALLLGLLAGFVVAGGRVDLVMVGLAAVVELTPVVLVLLLVGSRLRTRRRASGQLAGSIGQVRRAVVEVALVVLAVVAVASVRARGRDIAGGQTDWFAAVAPTLIALAAGLMVLRLLPPVFRWAAVRWAPRRGHVGFLGLRRAADSVRDSAVPLTAVVVAASLVSLLTSVTLTIGRERALVAHEITGAPARIDYTRLDADVVERLAARPGVKTVLPAVVASAQLVSGDQARRLTLVAVDPSRYAELLDGTPIDFAFREVTGTGKGNAGPLPLLVSAPGLDVRDPELEIGGRRTGATVTAVVPELRRITGGKPVQVALVPLDLLAARVPGVQPTTAFLRLDRPAADALARDATAESRPLGQLATDVTVAGALEDQLAARPLPSLVTHGYVAGTVFAGLLGLLALLLLIGASRPERMSTISQLRAMGMSARDAARIWLVELTPVLTVTAIVGALAGAIAPVVLAPALDLRPFVGGPAGPHPPDLPVPALGASVLAIIVLSVLALLIDARWSRRMSVAEGLRRGEQP